MATYAYGLHRTPRPPFSSSQTDLQAFFRRSSDNSITYSRARAMHRLDAHKDEDWRAWAGGERRGGLAYLYLSQSRAREGRQTWLRCLDRVINCRASKPRRAFICSGVSSVIGTVCLSSRLNFLYTLLRRRGYRERSRWVLCRCTLVVSMLIAWTLMYPIEVQGAALIATPLCTPFLVTRFCFVYDERTRSWRVQESLNLMLKIKHP